MLTFLFACFFAWNAANHELNRGTWIPPHFREATVWWAQWGLWLAVGVTVPVGFLAICVAIAQHEEGRDQVFATRQPANDFSPSAEEMEMERRIDELLDVHDDREDRG